MIDEVIKDTAVYTRSGVGDGPLSSPFAVSGQVELNLLAIFPKYVT